MSNCTIQLQNTVNFCSTHADLLPLSGVGGYTNEPALGLCNDALSELISDPNDWFFNRVEMPPIFTVPNKQDYLFAGATIFCLNQTTTPPNPNLVWLSQGWAIDLASNNAVTVSGGVVTINTLEVHRIPVGATIYLTGIVMTTGTAANYNSTFTDDGSVSQWNTSWTVTAVGPQSVSFAATTGQNNGDVGGAPGITNFGYLTSGTLQEVNNNSSPPNLYPLTVKRELAQISRVANPEKCAVMADLGTGVLKIRFSFCPGSTVFAAYLVYQAKAPLKVALTDTWAPFPDQFQTVYRQALLWAMYRYLNSPQAEAEYEKLKEKIAKVQATDDAAQTDVNLQPEEPLMDNSYWGWW